MQDKSSRVLKEVNREPAGTRKSYVPGLGTEAVYEEAELGRFPVVNMVLSELSEKIKAAAKDVGKGTTPLYKEGRFAPIFIVVPY